MTTGREGSASFQVIIDILGKLALEEGIAGVDGFSETLSLQCRKQLRALDLDIFAGGNLIQELCPMPWTRPRPSGQWRIRYQRY
jgi:hypothetical protein